MSHSDRFLFDAECNAQVGVDRCQESVERNLQTARTSWWWIIVCGLWAVVSLVFGARAPHWWGNSLWGFVVGVNIVTVFLRVRLRRNSLKNAARWEVRVAEWKERVLQWREKQKI